MTGPFPAVLPFVVDRFLEHRVVRSPLPPALSRGGEREKEAGCTPSIHLAVEHGGFYGQYGARNRCTLYRTGQKIQ
jgi:hypothetical protein